MTRPINEDTDALIVRTREAHEALKDLKAVLREVRDTIAFAQEVQAKLLVTCAQMVDEGIETSVRVGLESYHAAIAQAIEEAEQAVYHRFDVIAAILLGEADSGEELEAAARTVRKSMDKGQALAPSEVWQMEQMQQTLRRKIGDIENR